MTTRRELFPLIAGAAGISAAPTSSAAAASPSEPELRRVSYQSARTGKQRDYFVYLPRGFAQQKQWPVMLFLHGDGERGDARSELDYVLTHGPVFEAWCQRRDLPFVIISPQLDKFSRGEIPYIKNRDASRLPRRLPTGTNPRPAYDVREPGARCRERCPTTSFPMDPTGPPEGWSEMENELLAMVDRTVADFKGDAKRIYRYRTQLRRFRRLASRRATSAKIRRDRAHRRATATRITPNPSPKPNYRCGCSPADAIRWCRCATSTRRSTDWKRWVIPKCASPSKKTWVT